MLNSIQREAQAYDTIYKGRTLVLKVSGAEIDGEDFPVLVSDIRFLTQKGVRIVLAFGGGDQISTHYGKPREKIDGVAVTTLEVLTQGVLPAYAEIRAKLEYALPEGICIEPEALRCDLHDDTRFGLVGMPKEIVLPENDLSFVGFVGDSEGQRVNVNADDIAMQIVRQYRAQIEEIIFLTSTGGIQDHNGQVVPLLTEKRIDKILRGQDDEITVDGGMLKKVREIRNALNVIAKVVMTKTSGLRDEIEHWMGSGTLSINGAMLTGSPIRDIEKPIFGRIYEQNVALGIFRPRTSEEIDELTAHHHMLRAGNSPLGGFSLIPKGAWIELSTLWAGTIGNGLGQMLIDAAASEAGDRKMYALSRADDAIRAFERNCNFHSLGKLSEALHPRPNDVPEPLFAYPGTGNPRLFIKK